MPRMGLHLTGDIVARGTFSTPRRQAPLRADSGLMVWTMATRYYRIDLKLGAEWEVSEKEYKRKIKSKWYLPVYDSYYQTFSEDTYYDCRDSIVRIFYQRRDYDETD